MADPKPSAFEAASKQAAPNPVGEFIRYLAQNKKWWITPIFVLLLLLGLLVVLGGSGAAPFIYTLF